MSCVGTESDMVDLGGSPITQSLMWPLVVVEPHVSIDSLSGFTHAFVGPEIHLFIFDRPPHSFDVVQVPSLAVHAGLDTLLRQDMTSDSFVEVVQDVVDLTGTTKVSLDDRTKAPVSLPNCCSPIMGLDTSPEHSETTCV